MKRKLYFLSLVIAMIAVLGVAAGCTKKVVEDGNTNMPINSNEAVSGGEQQSIVSPDDTLATTSDVSIDIDKEVKDLEDATGSVTADDFKETGLSDIQ